MKLTFSAIELMKKLSEMKTNFSDAESNKAMKKVSVVMLQSVLTNFREQGTDKEKWKPLADQTIARRRKGKGKGEAKILQDTGTLKRSIFPFSSADEAGVATNIPYARVHHLGETITIPAMTIKPRRSSVLHFIVDGKDIFAKSAMIPQHEIKMPARPFMVLRDDHKKRVVDILKQHFTGQYGR
jgi:phage gpG-like protein